MSIPCIYRPVIIEYPHDVVMRPAPGPQAREAYVAALDGITPEQLVTAAESVCELIAEDFELDDDTADRVFGADGFGLSVSAAAAIPEIIAVIRRWVLAAIEEASWECRTTVGEDLIVDNYVEHIGGHPYTVVVTSDDTAHAGLLILKALRAGCVTCHP